MGELAIGARASAIADELSWCACRYALVAGKFRQGPARGIVHHLLLLLLLCLCWTTAIPALAAQAVGTVTRVQNQAQIGAQAAAEGMPVQMQDQLRTGPNGRLQVTFQDDTVLTLGENATVIVDRYVFNPEQSNGQMALRATQGALRFATGKLSQMRQKDISVSLPVAALAVRGTEFWAGIIDYQWGVLLLNGRVEVSNAGGDALLTQPNWGTDIPPPLKNEMAPGRPYEWPPDKVARALSMTGFGIGFGPHYLLPGLAVVPVLARDKDKDRPRPVSP